jgi:hypothetical protein
MQTVTSLKSVKAHQKQWFMLNQPNCAEPCQTPVKPPFTVVTGVRIPLGTPITSQAVAACRPPFPYFSFFAPVDLGSNVEV